MEKKFFDALKWIVGILEKHKVPYQISGGLAAHFYGAKRPLYDIDLDIPEDSFDNIYDDVKEFITFGPAQYKDESWDVKRMQLNFHGQEIDTGGAYEGKLYDHEKKKWDDSPEDLSTAYQFTIQGITVCVQNPKALIEYKKLLVGRDEQKIDIEAVKNYLKQIE